MWSIMQLDLRSVCLVIGYLLGLVLLIAGAATISLASETRRKIVHLGMGMACLALPLFFAHPASRWYVLALLILVLCGLHWLRSSKPNKYRDVLYAVQRRSFGEYYFALAVWIAYDLCRTTPHIYVLAILTLAFADTLGALAGRSFGRHYYHCGVSHKSIEGSIVFLCTSLCLSLIFFAPPLAILIAMTATIFEGLSGDGLDNLTVPLAIVFLCRHLAYRFSEICSTPAQIWQLDLLLLGVLALVLAFKQSSTLQGGACLSVVSVILLAYLSGGLGFALYPLTAFFGYSHMLPHRYRIPGSHATLPVLAVFATFLVWHLLPDLAPGIRNGGMALALALHLCMIGVADLSGKRYGQKKEAVGLKIKRTSLVAGKALAVSIIPFTLQTVLLPSFKTALNPILDTGTMCSIGAICLIMATIYFIMVATCLAFLYSTQKFPIAPASKRRWLRQSLVALTGSSMAIAMVGCIIDLI